MGCFFSPNAFENAPGYAFENGVRSVRREGNPYFYSVSWVSEGQQLAQQASQICNVVLGQHAENEASSKKNPDYDTSTYTLGSDEYEVCTCPSRADMPRTAGRNGFFRFAVSKFRWKGPKPGTWKNGKIYLCWRAPPHFVRFGGAPGFRQKRVFENRQIFAETTENVVRNGRGSKTHFCTVGFEIGHLRSGSNIVPIYFCFDWHFLSHSP